MNPIKLTLMILALVCFLLAAFEISIPKLNFIAAGLFLWALATILV